MVILEDSAEIDVVFPYDQVLAISYDLIPRIAYFSNIWVSDMVPFDMNSHQCRNIMEDVKKFYWEEPHVLCVCTFTCLS